MTTEATHTTRAGGQKRRIWLLCAVVLLIFVIFCGIMIHTALRPLSLEAGNPAPLPADFARYPFLPLQCESPLTDSRYEACGVHEVDFTLFGLSLQTTLTVADTTPPRFTAQKMAIIGGQSVCAEDFLTDIADVSAVTASYTVDGDITQPGTYAVHLTLTDAYGNAASADTSLAVYGRSNSLTVEAGITRSDLLTLLQKEIPHVALSGTLTDAALHTPGETEVEITVDEHTFPIHLRIQDTIPPQAEVKALYTVRGRIPSPETFLTSVTDATKVRIAYVQEPNCTTSGRQTVQIRLTDEGGNTTEVSALLTVYGIPSAITMEAGVDDSIVLSTILAGEAGCGFVGSYSFRTMAAGDHTVTVQTPGGNFDVSLTIQDTTPPSARPKRMMVYLPHIPDFTAVDFVEDIVDASPVTAEILGDVDYTTPGNSTVTIRLTDTSGNTADITSYLTVIYDTVGPVITGVRNLTTYVNGRLSYKNGITAVDSDGSPVTLTVDSSRVRLSVPGRYYVVYTATDASGNITEATAIVTVEEITEETLRPYAENVLNKILKSGMTKREQARAIYDWVEANVAYVAYADKSYHLRAAYHGFTTGRGDCYVYYAVSRVLLTEAGIDNMEICRDNPEKPHYWNLVNCGDGWYHFDTCPHYKNYPLDAFMLTDAEVRDYTENCVADYYSFDASLYPATPER